MSATNSNVYINLITDYQNKGVKQAESSLGSFEALAKKAAKTFAIAFSVEKIASFGKASVDAFIADQKALAVLDQTLSNVGLGFKAIELNGFVKDMSLATGVAKDQLIPALEVLATYTGDASKAQQLLQLSLDISAGTGKDLQTVSTALAKAYAGQVTSLSKLGIGLSTATLKAKDFKQIQDLLTKTYGGDAATAADTYAGKVDRLKAAFEELKVTIGQGLVDAFSSFSSTGSIDDSVSKIQTLSYAIRGYIGGVAYLIQAIGKGLSALGNNPVFKWLYDNSGALKWILHFLGQNAKDAVALGKQSAWEDQVRTNTDLLWQEYKMGKLTADAAKANADVLASKTKQNALDKASLALQQSQKIFNQQAAELWAATHSKQTEADQQRLQLMNDQAALQDAIDQKDATLATNLAARVTQGQNNILALNQAIDSIGVSTNPLQPLLDALDQGKITLDQMVADYLILTNGKATVPALPYNYGNDPFSGGSAGNGGLPSYATGGTTSSMPTYSFNPTPSWADPTGNLSVVVQIGDQTINDFVTTVTQNASATGTQISTSRLNTSAIA